MMSVKRLALSGVSLIVMLPAIGGVVAACAGSASDRGGSEVGAAADGGAGAERAEHAEPAARVEPRAETQTHVRVDAEAGAEEGTGTNASGATGTLPESGTLVLRLRETLRTGTGEEKKQALNIIRELQAVVLIPELIAAVADATPSPREGDTGWGFTGHHAASTLGEIAFILDGVRVETRGRARYSFHDDMYLGGEALRRSGRLEEVRANWAAWWSALRYER